jgi:hypothetical protein
LYVETDVTVEELIVRRPWDKEYCADLKAVLRKVLRQGGKVTIGGESRNPGSPDTELDDKGKPPPNLGSRSLFSSLFDYVMNSRGECVGYFDTSCPKGSKRL